MFRYSAFVASIILFNLTALSQSFQKLQTTVGVNHSISANNGSGGSFYDWNKDGLADITLAVNGAAPQFYQNVGNSFELLDIPFIENSGDIKSISWVDFDNDGDADLSINRDEGPFELFENDGAFNFTNISVQAGLPVTNHYGYGHSWGDYNRDGLLDLYICNYHYFEPIRNYLFRNNGDGTFTELAQAAGVDDGFNYSFQAVWCDFNFDGWQDLYVINDKISANHFYLNNGDGTFTDISSESGADIVIEAMTNSVADYDNDGDWDIYITNAIDSNVLLRALSPIEFTDYTITAGVEVEQMCWGSLFFDFDNNAWSDLVVATNFASDEFYVNQNDGSFSRTYPTLVAGTTNTFGFMEGDINNDGQSDLVQLSALPNISTVWRNTSNSGNNYLQVALEGVVSNRDAIGSRVEVYANGIAQRKHLCSSENYLNQNSQYLHFGLGTAEMIDSLFIAWPSGWTEKFYALSPNQRYSFLEGESLSLSLEYTSPFFCTGESAALSALGWDDYLWNTGSEEAELLVDEEGWFWVESTHESGLIIRSDSVFIAESPLPEVNPTIHEISCSGWSDGSIELHPSVPDASYEYLWNNGLTGNSQSGLIYGTYEVVVSDEIGCESIYSYTLEDPTALAFEIEMIPPSCFGAEDGMLVALGNADFPDIEYSWNNQPGDSVLDNLSSGFYSFEAESSPGCTWTWQGFLPQPPVLDFDLLVGEPLCAGESNGTLSIVQLSGEGPFEFYLEDTMVGNEVTELLAGTYQLSAVNANQCAWEETIIISEPDALELSWEVMPEDLGNDAVLNIFSSGGSPPYSYSLNGSEVLNPAKGLAAGDYQLVVEDANGCTMEDSISIESTSSIENPLSNQWSLYPNPSDHFLNISGFQASTQVIEYLITDSRGKLVKTGEFISRESIRIDISELAPQLYFLHLIQCGKSFRFAVSR